MDEPIRLATNFDSSQTPYAGETPVGFLSEAQQRLTWVRSGAVMKGLGVGLMNETLSFPTRSARPLWDLTVVGSRELTQGLRRVSLIGDDLEGLDPRPGQQVLLTLPGDGPAAERRRYTIAAFDSDELRLDLDVPIRGDAPAARWLKSASIGDRVLAEPPPAVATLRR